MLIKLIGEVDGSSDTFRVGRIEDLFQDVLPTSGFGLDIAPDGQRLLVASAPEGSGLPSRMEPLTLVLNWTRDLERP